MKPTQIVPKIMKKNEKNVKSICKSYNTMDRSITASWVLHAIKITLGYESVRQEILVHYFPTLHRGNITKIRKAGFKNHVITFDAFIKRATKNPRKSKNI